MKKTELRQLIREEIQKTQLNEGMNKDFKKLLGVLKTAIKMAEKIGQTANDDPESAMKMLGGSGSDVANHLMAIYNGFMTGDRKNTEYQDEYFK